MRQTTTSNKAYFCPTCGSPSIEVSALAGGAATCLTCKWSGNNDDLVVHVFQHDMGSSEDVLRAFTQEFKGIIGRYMAAPLAQLLNKWGFFMNNPPQPEELTRYAVAVGKASMNAILEVRREMELERAKRDGN